MKRRSLTLKAAVYLVMIIIAIIMFFPIVWIISSSFKTLTAITSYPPQLIPKEPQLSNYVEVLTRRNALIYLRNTLILIVGNTVGTLISSSLVAYPLARMNFKGKKLIFSLILATMMVPSSVTIIPQFILFRRLNWIDTLYPLFVPAFFAYPYNVFLFRQFFLTIPKELDEAAMIDGCSRFKIFYKILVPLAKPIFITIGILSSIYWWNELFTPLIYINSENLKPLTTALISFKAEGQFVTQWNLVMAMATLMIIPPMILYMVGQRYLVEGIKMSGLKG
ncbi:binding-protein-dependent transport systems inner membrane component [Caldicellulosiruptor owensensis OL]|uniref:Binding-protein-dependent transport systems inner membrane component n=1 Tax=Caldicellulosiruptor owensensis (strain ATCC 700167 / DSM 13100 / OL) TaxID=632518 RepID=E4Q5R0_CALOW|nr:carbohydrate ABC transporter permease [Caldicellulosiruptor owensensis]ADQ05469.1 binding-protein-dependent transport systems inner membrane component [Caldicellulosiruptor owensensis OL]